MPTWDERFAAGDYPRNPEPSSVLREYVEAFPDGRALDVATGTGRNAVFLAESGYTVDALDQSKEGLNITRENAAESGVEDNIACIQADVPTYEFPEDRYAAIAISYYRAVDRFPDIKEALIDGGVLFVEHHLRSTDGPLSGPSTDRYRFASNELLHACLDMTVLYYDETTTPHEGKRSATARVIARNTTGPRQSYPGVDCSE